MTFALASPGPALACPPHQSPWPHLRRPPRMAGHARPPAPSPCAGLRHPQLCLGGAGVPRARGAAARVRVRCGQPGGPARRAQRGPAAAGAVAAGAAAGLRQPGRRGLSVQAGAHHQAAPPGAAGFPARVLPHPGRRSPGAAALRAALRRHQCSRGRAARRAVLDHLAAAHSRSAAAVRHAGHCAVGDACPLAHGAPGPGLRGALRLRRAVRPGGARLCGGHLRRGRCASACP